MKKYILSVAFLFAVLITPMAQVHAAGLTPVQVSAIVSLLQSLGVDQSVINTIQTSLSGGATTQQSQPTYPSGCTSLAGFSLTTGNSCDGSATSITSIVTAAAIVRNPVAIISNSASGPFVQNGTAVNNLPVYARIVFANPNIKSYSPQGCIQPVGTSGCSSNLGYRDYLSSEWLDTTTIQTVVQNPWVYPLTTYELYIKLPGGEPIKAGTLQLIAPSAVTTTTTTSTVAGCAPGALFSATTALRCDGTTPAAVTLSAVHLTSLFPSSGPVGTTVTINASGLLGTNNIYLNGIPVDTLSTSGTLPPTWISFGIPPQLPYCSGTDRSCVWGPALTPGTYTVRVQNTNGTSNSINFIVFSIDGNGNGSPSGPGVGGGTGIGGALGTVIGTLTDAMAALSAAITGTPSLADTNVALANAMSNAEVALSEAHDSMSAANVSAAADAVAAAATAAADAGIASGIAANADAAATTAADAAAAASADSPAPGPSGDAPGDGTGGGDSPGASVGTW